MRENQNRVYTRAYRLLADAKQAEDVVQDVFLKAYQAGETLWRDARAPGWLHTVARHLCFNHLARYRKRWQLFDHSDSDVLSALPTHGADSLQTEAPETQLNRAQWQAQLQTALLALPDHQRIPLVLFHFEDLSYEDIAAQLNISMAKLKTDIHRARSTLAKLVPTLSEEALA